MKSAPRRAAALLPRPLLAAARALPVVGQPFSSEEHFGRPARSELHLPEALRDAYASGAELPDGAQVLLLWRSMDQIETAPPSVLLMEKSAGRWRYQLERSDGTNGTSTELARCARCHAEAPSDDLFRVPLGAP